MTTIAQLFGSRCDTAETEHPATVTNTRVGIEVELEGIHPESHPEGWYLEGDGSLRNNGVEFVFRGPAGGQRLINRLATFEEYIAQLRHPPICSERTSVHVHVDVRDMEWEQLWRMVVVYVITEPYLFSLCGEGRDDNIYSLSYEKGQDQLEMLSHLNSFDEYQDFRHDFCKYSALNIKALADFGSLEFRGHEGTYDTARILKWTNHLLALKEFAVTNSLEVDQYPKMMSSLGPRRFLQTIFGDLVEGLDASITDQVYRGTWAAEDVLFSRRLSPIISLLRQAEGGHSLRQAFEAVAGGGRAPEVNITTPTPHVHVMPSRARARVLLRASIMGHVTSNHPRMQLRPEMGGAFSIDARQAATVMQAAIGPEADISVTTDGIGRLGSIFESESE
jgi:hypothetical protein